MWAKLNESEKEAEDQTLYSVNKPDTIARDICLASV